MGNKKYLFLFIMSVLFFGTGLFLMPLSARADEPLVIVIDPGHGGENLGAQYEGYVEKEMTMRVARAMQEELCKYEGVEVYLTHDTDEDMSLKERAAFAGDIGADFLFCLHFNSSENHNYFGAEVWVPGRGSYYAKGYSFAQIQMQALESLGLYSRGIKTRLNDRDEDYYGILRHCTEEGVPSALIEHCHLDHEKDEKFYRQGTGQLEELGRLDATAAAKYFQLKSEILGVDYSNFPVPETAVPQGLVRPDKTGPQLCSIEVSAVNEDTGEITVHMEAEDPDSYILYYNYSLDGGNYYFMPEEWPRPEAWDRSAREIEFTIKIPFGQEVSLCAGACNGFDVWAQSNTILVGPIPDPVKLQEELLQAQENALRKAQEQYEEIHHEEPAAVTDEEARRSMAVFWGILAGIALLMVSITWIMVKMLFLLRKGSRKR
ncbi:sporulation-specific N-acetylmuramoyl-L-alanine amidase [Lachnospiraceae bacterium]|nr:sporulation-specific N-acetylmuramoyl-L-alanine amidase [Lachnospiraceae bacterium]